MVYDQLTESTIKYLALDLRLVDILHWLLSQITKDDGRIPKKIIVVPPEGEISLEYDDVMQ